MSEWILSSFLQVPNPGTKHMLILVITINLLQMFLLTVGFIPNASRPQPVAAVDSERPSGSVNVSLLPRKIFL